MGGNDRKRKKDTLFRVWGIQVKGIEYAPCWWCLKILVKDPLATIEHVWPRSLGGPHALTNLRIACKKCNEGHVNPYDPAAGNKVDLLEAPLESIA